MKKYTGYILAIIACVGFGLGCNSQIFRLKTLDFANYALSESNSIKKFDEGIYILQFCRTASLADDSIKEMRAAEDKKADLTRQRAKYESALGREELARKQGYRRPDETPIGD